MHDVVDHLAGCSVQQDHARVMPKGCKRPAQQHDISTTAKHLSDMHALKSCY